MVFIYFGCLAGEADIIIPSLYRYICSTQLYRRNLQGNQYEKLKSSNCSWQELFLNKHYIVRDCPDIYVGLRETI